MRHDLGKLGGLVHMIPGVIEMHGKGQDKADLGKLGGLQSKAAQLVPAVVVGAARIVADGKRAQL